MSESDKSDERFISGLELLEVTEDSFVVVKTRETDVSPAAAEEICARLVGSIRTYCQRHELKGISVCFVPAGFELSVMSEKDMRDFGWTRISKLAIVQNMPTGIRGN